MQQLGVIAGCESVGLERTHGSAREDSFFCALKSNGMVLLVRRDDPAAKLKLPIYQVTSIGSQVMSLGKFRANIGYLRKIGDHIKSQGFDVELAKYVDTGPNTFNYFGAEKL